MTMNSTGSGNAKVMSARGMAASTNVVATMRCGPERSASLEASMPPITPTRSRRHERPLREAMNRGQPRFTIPEGRTEITST